MFRKAYYLCLLFFTTLFLISCNKEEDITKDTLLELNTSTIRLNVNQSYKFDLLEDIIIESENKEILDTNDKKKEITGKSSGTTKVTLYIRNNLKHYKSLIVTVFDEPIFTEDETGEITIDNPVNMLYLDDEYKIDALSKNDLDLVYESSNPEIAEVDEKGNLKILNSGFLSVRISLLNKPEIHSTIEIEIKPYINPENFIQKVAITNPTIKNITVTGYQFSYEYQLLGSLSYYYFDELNIIERFIPKTNKNRPGTKINGNTFKALYVTMHDTGATDNSADALRHSKYWSNSTVSTSAHFSTGNDGIYQLLPYDEIGYHAGDGTTEKLTFTDTLIKAETLDPAIVTISSDGYFMLNGIKSTIKAPTKPNGKVVTNKELPTTGINNYVDSKTGTYFIGKTYYNTTYNTLSNYGGNLNSIGIESTVNQGSNIYQTWAMTAKLIGQEILPSNNLTPIDVKQHNTFSGKNCPQTMREADEWNNFIKMCEVEYLMATQFDGWTLTFECDSPYIDSNGLIKSLPNKDTLVKYKLRLTNHIDYDQTFTFTANIDV